MRRMLDLSLPAAVLLALVACPASTGLTSTWKDPATSQLKFKRILVVAMTKDASMRRAVEDELVRRVPKAVPSYTVLSDAELTNVEAAKAKVVAAGFDGVVAFRPVGTRQETTVVPGTVWYTGPTYGSWWGYYDYGWGAAYDPGYVRQDEIVTVETLVYSLAENKLVWAGRSETMNPASVKSLVNDIVDAVALELEREHLI